MKNIGELIVCITLTIVIVILVIITIKGMDISNISRSEREICESNGGTYFETRYSDRNYCMYDRK